MRSGANLSFFHFHTCSMFIIHQLMHSIALNSQCPAMEVLSVWDKTKRARVALEARVCAQQQQQQQQPRPQQQKPLPPRPQPQLRQPQQQQQQPLQPPRPQQRQLLQPPPPQPQHRQLPPLQRRAPQQSLSVKKKIFSMCAFQNVSSEIHSGKYWKPYGDQVFVYDQVGID